MATIEEYVEKRCPTKKRVKLKPFYATVPIDMNNREEIGIWEHDRVILENMFAEVFAKRNREKQTKGEQWRPLTKRNLRK